jgi:hypothetical protein
MIGSLGRTVQLKDGYPDTGARGIRLAIADLSELTVSFTPTSVTYSKSGAPAPARCAVTYTASPAASVAATITDKYKRLSTAARSRTEIQGIPYISAGYTRSVPSVYSLQAQGFWRVAGVPEDGDFSGLSEACD